MSDPNAPADLGRLSGFRELVGYDVVTWRDAFAEVRLDIRADHLNRMGIVHGGVYMTLLDAAMGHAATYCPEPGHTRRCVTVSLTTHFLSPARQGAMIATGRLESIDNRIAACRGEIHDLAGTLLMAAQASFRYFPGSELAAGVPRKS
ncbi:MAG: PaaI family thioesterase [Pseudomonadota bacterium]